MDIVLVCRIKDIHNTITSLLIANLMASISKENAFELKIDYPSSKLFINIVGDKGDSMYIKKCHLDDLIDEIKKIESI